MSWTPFKKKKPSEQIQEYLDSKKSGVILGGGNANAPMARPSTPNQYVVGQVQNPTVSVSSGVIGGLSGALKSPKPPEDTKPPEYVLTLPEQPPQQAEAESQTQGPTYTLTLPTAEEQALALEQARKQAHMAAFADQMAAMDAEFWRIAQNPGSMLGANESPYYSLYMKQYQQRARDRETNAYTRATAGTGGYGSSFATMAGDQAYRETMQEFDELAPTLIKSKSERMAEILQEREMLKAMGEQMNEESNTLTLSDGTTVEVTDAARELYAGYLDSFTQGTGYDTLKTAMINGGASEADADQAIAMFKKLDRATITDKISSFEKNPTASDADKIMADAKASGTWEQVQPKVSAGLSDAYIKALNDLDGGYRLLGYDEETWSGLSEEEKATAILQAGGEAVKSGVMSEADFAKLISKDAKTAVIEIGNSDDRPIVKSRAVFNAISGILVCVENGTLSREAADQIIADMADSSVVKAAYEKHAKFLDSIANDKELKKKLGIEAMPDGFWRLDDAQEEALRVLDRIYKQY